MKTKESMALFHYLKALQGVIGLFPVRYVTAGALLKGLGAKRGAPASPRNLRGFPAMNMRRSRIPRAVVSTVILRFEDLETTRVYLDKTADSRAILWMDILHGRREPNYHYPAKR